MAQCLLCTVPAPGADSLAHGSDADDRPLRVEVTADLDFSRLVAGSGGGSLTIGANGGAQASGAVAPLGGLGFSGQVRVEGAPGRNIRVDLPDEVVLTSSGGGIVRVRDLVTSLPAGARLGPDGRLEFSFGGRLDVTGDGDGDYRGRIEVTVSYE